MGEALDKHVDRDAELAGLTLLADTSTAAPTGPGLAGDMQFAQFAESAAWEQGDGSVPATKPAAYQLTAEEQAEKDRLSQQYGVAPRRWVGWLDGRVAMTKALPLRAEAIAGHLTAVASSMDLPFAFTGYELAMNFLAEGGYFIRDLERAEADQAGWEGFARLGIDMLINHLEALTPWMSPSLLAFTLDPANHVSHLNEQRQQVTTINPPTLALAIESNAVMYADARHALYRDCRELQIPFQTLSPQELFFWTSLYYNMHHNREGASARLRQHAPAWATTAFEGVDDHGRSASSPKFNAAWRTATWDAAYNRDAYAAGLAAGAMPEQPREGGLEITPGPNGGG